MTTESTNEPQRSQILMIEAVNKATAAINQAIDALHSIPSFETSLNTPEFEAAVKAARDLRDAELVWMSALGRVAKPLYERVVPESGPAATIKG
jgi:hypothetical protein